MLALGMGCSPRHLACKMCCTHLDQAKAFWPCSDEAEVCSDEACSDEACSHEACMTDKVHLGVLLLDTAANISLTACTF